MKRLLQSTIFLTATCIAHAQAVTPVDSIPDTLTLPRFSVSIYELPVRH